MEIIEATLLGLIIFIASIAAAITIMFLICYLLFWLFNFFPAGLADKIGAVLDNLLMIFFGIFSLVIFFVAFYQVGIDFLR